tara:strand:+ start:8511 stop:9785 length:1275 start_codon:yes stop_codon:yes gene_type:complete
MILKNINQKIEDNFEVYLKECPEVKTTIHWYDLYEGHYINLDKNFQKQLFEKVIRKAGNYSELGRILNIGRKTISACSKGKSNPQIKVLKKIASYINYQFSAINRKIVKISNLKPNLPFKLHNKEGAEIRAAFLSDGHVDKSPTAGPQYCALEKESHKRLIKLCKEIFGKFNIKTRWGHKTYVTRFPAALNTPLRLSGVPSGDKRLTNCYVPQDILENEEFMKVYLRQVFDDEGNVSYKNDKRSVRLSRSVDITRIVSPIRIKSEIWTPYKLPTTLINNLLIGEKIILEKLGIKTNINPDGIYRSKNNKITAKWRLVILQQDNLKKFSELINFNLINKRKKLENILKSYKINKRHNGEGDRHAAEFLKKVYKEKGFFKFGDLGRELVRMGRSHDSAGVYLRNLQKKNIIKKIKYGHYIFTNDKY